MYITPIRKTMTKKLYSAAKSMREVFARTMSAEELHGILAGLTYVNDAFGDMELKGGKVEAA